MKLADILECYHDYLIEELDHFPVLCDYLYANELISEKEKDKILAKSIRYEKAVCFLKILKKKVREGILESLFYAALDYVGSSYIVKHITSRKRKLRTFSEQDGKKYCTGLTGIFSSVVEISKTSTPIQCLRDLEGKDSTETFIGFLSFKSDVGISANKTRYQWWYVTDGTDTIRVTAFGENIDKFSGRICRDRSYKFENFKVKKTETEYINGDVRRTLHTVDVHAKKNSEIEDISCEIPDYIECDFITVSDAKKLSLNKRVHVKGICLRMIDLNDESLLLTIADEEGKCIRVKLEKETAKSMSSHSRDSHPIIILKYGIMKEEDNQKCIHVRLYSELEVTVNNHNDLKNLIKSKDKILKAFENEGNCIPEMTFDDLLNSNGDEDLHCKVKAKIFAIKGMDMTYQACPDCNRPISHTKRKKGKPYKCRSCKKTFVESDTRIRYNVSMRIGYVGESQVSKWATLTNKAATDLFEKEPEEFRQMKDDELKEYLDEFKEVSFLFTIHSSKSSDNADCNIKVTDFEEIN